MVNQASVDVSGIQVGDFFTLPSLGRALAGAVGLAGVSLLLRGYLNLTDIPIWLALGWIISTAASLGILYRQGFRPPPATLAAIVGLALVLPLIVAFVLSLLIGSDQIVDIPGARLVGAAMFVAGLFMHNSAHKMVEAGFRH